MTMGRVPVLPWYVRWLLPPWAQHNWVERRWREAQKTWGWDGS